MTMRRRRRYWIEVTRHDTFRATWAFQIIFNDGTRGRRMLIASSPYVYVDANAAKARARAFLRACQAGKVSIR